MMRCLSVIVELEKDGVPGTMQFPFGKNIEPPNFMNMFFRSEYHEGTDTWVRIGSKVYRYELLFELNAPTKAWSLTKTGKKRYTSAYESYIARKITMIPEGDAPAVPVPEPEPELLPAEPVLKEPEGEPLPLPIPVPDLDSIARREGFVFGTLDHISYYPDHTMVFGAIEDVVKWLLGKGIDIPEKEVCRPDKATSLWDGFEMLLANTVPVRCTDDTGEVYDKVRAVKLPGTKVDAGRFERASRCIGYPAVLKVNDRVVLLEGDGRAVAISPLAPLRNDAYTAPLGLVIISRNNP